MKYPKDEIIWVTKLNEEGIIEYIITSKQARDMYFLYAFDGTKFIKKGKNKNPMEFENKWK